MNSKRQKALELLKEGKSIKDICEELGISRRTLERWRLKPEFKEVSAEYRENSQNFRKRMATLIPQVIDEVEAIAMSDDVRTGDKLRALTALGTWGGLGEKPEPEPRRIEIPDHDFTEDEIRDSFYQFQDKLKLLAIGQIVEGSKAQTLAKMREILDNLNAIMLEINRFYDLTLKERLFDKNIKTYVNVGTSTSNVLPFEEMKKLDDLYWRMEDIEDNWNKTDEERGITPEMRRQADEFVRKQFGDS